MTTDKELRAMLTREDAERIYQEWLDKFPGISELMNKEVKK